MTTTYDAWAAAGQEPVNTKEYYGQILVDCVAMVFPGEKGSKTRPVVYDPNEHKGKQPFTMITMTLDPLPEMHLSNETSKKWINYSPDWVKITMPSIKKLGFTTPDGSCDLRKFNESWVKFKFVPGFQKNKDPEKENYKTMEFLALYKNERECTKAYMAENTSNAEVEMPKSTSTPAVDSAMVFVRSIAENAMRSGLDVNEAVDDFLQKNVAACAGLKIDSPEVQALLKEFDENPPF